MGGLVTGFDLGGAHLKAAQVTASGRVTAALQWPCPLWQGLDRLEASLAAALARLAPADRVALTMTGEMTDLFPDRTTGVVRLLAAMQAALPQAELRVWAGRHGFVTPDAVPALAGEVASANWLATAALAASRLHDALLIDLGSTTTDVLVLSQGRVTAEGFDDRARLACGELVYTGLTRTPLMAVATRAPFAGRWVALMNEHFATMADVHRLLGTLPEEADQHPAADGGAKTVDASARRLARMIGADLADGSMADWRRLALWFAACQMRRIEDAVLLQLSRGLIPEAAPVLGAGCGRHLLPELARRLGRPWRDFGALIEAEGEAAAWAATCAPAVAVAWLRAAALRAAGE